MTSIVVRKLLHLNCQWMSWLTTTLCWHFSVSVVTFTSSSAHIVCLFVTSFIGAIFSYPALLSTRCNALPCLASDMSNTLAPFDVLGCVYVSRSSSLILFVLVWQFQAVSLSGAQGPIWLVETVHKQLSLQGMSAFTVKSDKVQQLGTMILLNRVKPELLIMSINHSIANA